MCIAEEPKGPLTVGFEDNHQEVYYVTRSAADQVTVPGVIEEGRDVVLPLADGGSVKLSLAGACSAGWTWEHAEKDAHAQEMADRLDEMSPEQVAEWTQAIKAGKR